jgi:hypothetical protein
MGKFFNDRDNGAQTSSIARRLVAISVTMELPGRFVREIAKECIDQTVSSIPIIFCGVVSFKGMG